MPNYDFNKDLPIAKKTEREVGQLMQSKYTGFKVLKYGDDNRFDILASFQNKTMTFEVKEDFTHAKTGNVGLEFSCRGKLSGISVSKAEYYIYKIHNADGTCGIYLFRTEVLKKMANDKLYFRIVNGGDVGSNSMNYLFKDYVFYKYAKKIG
ncbi:MAG TPA: hypothetical protein DGG95_07260 [Cytophagales bacterium]|jgi:hypothetical protein|nr:hypothetical protein [Cytophagales bacterium]